MLLNWQHALKNSPRLKAGGCLREGSVAVCPVEEGDDLTAVTGGIGGEDAFTHAVGDSVCHGPKHCVMVVGAGSNVRKDAASADGRLVLGAPQECDDLCTGTNGVRTEGRFGSSLGDTVFDRPGHGFVIIAVLSNIAEAVVSGLRAAGGSPEESDDLSAGRCRGRRSFR